MKTYGFTETLKTKDIDTRGGRMKHTWTTPWYPASIKPVREGWYEVKMVGIPEIEKRYWNGTYWQFSKKDDRSSMFGDWTGDQWRGLTKKTK